MELTDQLAERSILTTRLINKPVPEVFAAFTDPEKLKKWWGPNGFTNTFNVFDLQPGGKWSFVMHGPDGKNYPNESVFKSVIQDKEIVLDHVNAPLFQATFTFEEADAGTKLTFQQAFETPEMRDTILNLIGDSNEQNINRLEQVLGV